MRTLYVHQGSAKLIAIAAIAVAAAALLFLFFLQDEQPRETDDAPVAAADDEENEVDAGWTTYVNEAYGFAIDHPSDWTVREFPDHPDAPTFNFFPPETDTAGLPFTHHSEAVTHVSIFPQGVPTEGFFGETTATNVSFGVRTERARDYTLGDGTRFATFAGLPDGNDQWSPAGFIFAHVVSEDAEVVCMRAGVAISEEICDPLAGDTLVRRGSVRADQRAVTVRMLESFRFTEE